MNRNQLDTTVFDQLENSILSIIVSTLKNVTSVPKSTQKKRRYRKGQGQLRINHLLNSNHDAQIYSALRMTKDTFLRLQYWLSKNTQLRSSKYISIEAKLCIFLAITTRPALYRDIYELFGFGLRQIGE